MAEPDWVPLPSLAERVYEATGVRVPYSTLWRLRADGLIAAVRRSNRCFVDLSVALPAIMAEVGPDQDGRRTRRKPTAAAA